MKPSNPNFWTRVKGQLAYRNLEREQLVYADDVFGSFRQGIIDEPIVIYYEIFNNVGGGKDDSIYQTEQCFIKPNDVVLDIGGNIGIFNRFAADRGAKKIYSFEPVQENFQLLMMNKASNSEAHRLAISDVDNQAVEIAYKPWAPGGSSILKHDGGELQTVMSMSIDTLWRNGIIEQPTFIKVDIEGAEVQAFRGMSDEMLAGVRCISMEMHTNVVGNDGALEIYNRLKGLGFNDFTIWFPTNDNQVYFWK